MFTAALFTIAKKDMAATEMAVNRCKDKEDVIYTYYGTLFSHQKE